MRRMRALRALGTAWLLGLTVVMGAALPGCNSCSSVQDPLPKAAEGRFAILVTGFEGDEDQNKDGEGDTTTGLVQGFVELNAQVFGGARTGEAANIKSFQILTTKRILEKPKGADPDWNAVQGHEEARKWLEESGASVLVWGQVLARGAERVPLQWAMTQNNLGNAHWSLAKKRNNDKALLCQALDLHLQAFDVAQQAKASYKIEMYGRNIQRDLEALAPKNPSQKPTCTPPLPDALWNSFRASLQP